MLLRAHAQNKVCRYIEPFIQDFFYNFITFYFPQDLTAKCVDGAISDNIEELVESPDWLSLQVECVEAIMKSSSLLVPNEFYMYEALQRWLMHQRKTENEDFMMDTMKSVSNNIYRLKKGAGHLFRN